MFAQLHSSTGFHLDKVNQSSLLSESETEGALILYASRLHGVLF
jgi:hypothetical protein